MHQNKFTSHVIRRIFEDDYMVIWFFTDHPSNQYGFMFVEVFDFLSAAKPTSLEEVYAYVEDYKKRMCIDI